MQRQVHEDISDVFAAPDGKMAQARLKGYIEKYAVSAPSLSQWMEENLSEGLMVFELPQKHRKKNLQK